MAVKRSALLFLAGLALTFGAAQGDYRESYRLGVEAYEAGDLATAASLLADAIAENPESSGNVLRRYTPYYYRGLALSSLGRCREALPMIEEAERQDKVRDKDVPPLVAARDGCRDLLARVATARNDAEAALSTAQSAAASVSRLRGNAIVDSVWRTGSPSFSDREAEGLRQIEAARTSLTTGDRDLDPAELEAARGQAEAAETTLAALARDAEAQRVALSAVRQEHLDRLQKMSVTTRRDIRFVYANLAPLPDALAAAVSAAESAVGVAELADLTKSGEEIDALHDEVQAQLRSLRRVVRAPPDALIEGATAYFDGDYDLALELLAGAEPLSESRARAQACLLTVATRWSLARRDGTRQPDLRDELQTCREIDTVIVPPAGLFPPEFRSLWQEAVQGPTEAEPPP